MHILQVHNRYIRRGGEDEVLTREGLLLRSAGHRVSLFGASNEEICLQNPIRALQVGLETLWSHSSYNRLARVINELNPDVVHVHNTFPRLSPSIYWAAFSRRRPVVQTLHNFRLVCLNALLLRKETPCQLCVKAGVWPGLIHRCYRGTIPSLAVATMLMVHRLIGSYTEKVDAYIVLSDFAKSLFVQGGIPAEKIYVKPNFVHDPCARACSFGNRQKQVLFVGRLSAEKGLALLLEAWKRLKPRGYTLVIVGDGPEKENLQGICSNACGVEWRGWLSNDLVLAEMKASLFVVMASRCYEGFPMVVAESLAVGTPVIAPSHGGFPEMITDRVNGFLFTPGSVESLANKLEGSLSLRPEMWIAMSKAARETYLERYTPEKNYEMLMDIYAKAVATARSK